MYDIKEDVVRISVRNLVEFICSSGDIDNRFTGMTDVRLMQEGTRMHKKIQKSMGNTYRAEVALKMQIPVDNTDIWSYRIQLEGRADGIICELQENENGDKIPLSEVTIDEIKTVQTDVKKLEEPVYVHKAQAMCYGYIYAVQNQLDSINIQLTYCNPDTEEIKRFSEKYEFEKISSWFEELINKFKRWTDYLFRERQLRQESIESLTFPFEYRKGQRNLVVSVYRAIENEKNIFIQAPTGVGKTISTVFPAVQAVGQGFADKIFYLTSKTITRTVAQNTFELLRNHGLHIKTETLTAKDKICMLDERDCNPVKCECAKGHFDRVNDAVYDVITHEDNIDRDTILQYAIKHNVCPFEMSLDISYWCDTIVCDYNYVFDPNASLKRYFSDGGKGEYIFLVDEAHNLVDRAREMYSAVLKKEDFLAVKNIVKEIDKRLAGSLESCNRQLLELKRECDGCTVMTSAGKFPLAVERCYSNMQKFFEKHKTFPESDTILALYFDMRHFLNMYDCMDEKYIIYNEFDSNGDFLFRLFCVDPSGNLSERLSQGVSTIFFSATLLPVNYFKEMLSGDVNDYAVYAESPFDVKNRRIVIAGDVSSRYKRRNTAEFRKICRYIMDTAESHNGKYMVFFPSYSFMEAVKQEFVQMCDCGELSLEEDLISGSEKSVNIVVQSSNMKEMEKENFLNLFDDESVEGTLIGFCVMGGIFSEGIDLKEESLIGVIIVGTGLPMVCRERELLRGYFDETGKDGYAYAYIYPGMNKVLQAAGRVIRTDKDRGVIVLLDDRFLNEEYRRLYPREWECTYNIRFNQTKDVLVEFWEKIVQNI